MTKKLIIGCLITLGIGFGMTSCSDKEQKPTEKKAVVKIDTIRVADANNELQFPGRIVAASETNASFKVAGTLRRVLVREGDAVRQGQLLAEMDPSDYNVQLSATEAEYAQVKAEAERVMGLYEDGGTTASNYDKARYGLKQIEAKLQNHRNQVSYTRIYSPINGTVQTRYFEGGETVAAGMPILSILSGGNLEVEVNLPPASYMKRDQFNNFTCICDVLPDEPLALTLINILPRANSNQLYTMRLKLDDPEHQLAAGMTAWVKIGISGEGERQFVVPTTSLLNKDEKTYVYTYNAKDHKVKLTPVEPITLHTNGTAIVRGELQQGGLIVSSGIRHITDGIVVEPMAKTSRTNVGGLL